ncbi:MAG: UDP-N-acetylmuramate--L-alanine ligase [Chloroflexota bacterium]|nr:UDP-N-acetylmuramate--L-alanine ligase [Chloroflexota bacterium]
MDFSNHHYHFIGIGGAGMSALAAALLDLGATVSGSDLAPSDVTRELEGRGVRIYAGHAASNLGGADRVVLTGAVPPSNSELATAQERGLSVVKRAVLLGQLMDLRRGVAVAGTHGKTTTSAMLAWVLSRCGRDPSYMIGGTIRGLGAGGHWGGGAELVAEADEYDRSFLQLRPEVSVITNIETDHLEYYGSADAIYAAFGQFVANTRSGGLLVMCADDAGTSGLLADLMSSSAPFRMQSYGTSDRALWQPSGLSPNSRGGTDYVVLRDGVNVCVVRLRLPGKHNVLNSLAALAACVELGVTPAEAALHLGEFAGTGRRFEFKGEAGGITIVDDYAHHPTEIAATLEAARQRFPGRRIVVLFQPHTYTRTRDFLPEFASSLDGADYVVVTEIYASRERDTLGMSGKQIVERITSSHAEFAPSLAQAEQMLLDVLVPGDVLLTMGAGDVWKGGETILRELEGIDEEHTSTVGIYDEPGKRMHDDTVLMQNAEPKRAAFRPRPDTAALLEEATRLKAKRDEPMSKHSSLRIGGPADLFVEAGSVPDIAAVVTFARNQGIPYLLLGNGTNILVGDYGVRGLVIYNRAQAISHEKLDANSSLWVVDSGVLFSRLARISCDEGWTGQEWANSVPGSIGGGVVSNAGAHGKDLKDDLQWVDVLTPTGAVERWSTGTLRMGYRTSRFKAHGHRNLSAPEIVLRAGILLYRDIEKLGAAKMRGYLEERQASQPQGKSAGSTFKNPPGSSAGYLIEQVGLKGQRHGQAQFSAKHANFMMNLGGATASDVQHLMDLARGRVQQQFGIDLEPEIEFVGDE